MIEVIKADKRHFSDFGWLQTYWLFSFSSYFDPHNIQFGALRVFNDDVVKPGTGFPTHPHEEMEIITIVLEGEMTHQDSMGNKAVIKAGDVLMTRAGVDTLISVQGEDRLEILPELTSGQLRFDPTAATLAEVVILPNSPLVGV